MNLFFPVHPFLRTLGIWGAKALFTILLAFCLLKAFNWARADFAYREFASRFKEISSLGLESAAIAEHIPHAYDRLQKAVSLAPDSALYRRSRGQFRQYLKSLEIYLPKNIKLNLDFVPEFIAAAQRSPTWESPYLDLALLCLRGYGAQPGYLNFDCQKMYLTATQLNPTFSFPHEKWAAYLTETLSRRLDPSAKDLQRLCAEFGNALKLTRSPGLWKLAFGTAGAFTREYGLLRLLNPKNPAEWADLAAALAQDGVQVFSGARESFLADLLQQGQPLKTYLAVAQILARLGLPQEGEFVLSRYLSLKPRDPKAWQSLVNLVDAHWRNEKTEEIKGLIASALESAEYQTTVWLFFANTLFKIGDNEAAAKIYRQILARDPQADTAYLEMGDLLTKVQADKEASSAYEESVKMRSNNMDAWIRLGLSLARQGEYQLATQKLEEALSLDPNNPKVKAALRQIGIY